LNAFSTRPSSPPLSPFPVFISVPLIGEPRQFLLVLARSLQLAGKLFFFGLLRLVDLPVHRLAGGTIGPEVLLRPGRVALRLAIPGLLFQGSIMRRFGAIELLFEFQGTIEGILRVIDIDGLGVRRAGRSFVGHKHFDNTAVAGAAAVL
jgi:hypothetical protein